MDNDAQGGVGRFFDALSGDYTETIERCFPRYREMLWAVLDYLPPGRTFRSILDLGSGTGNLSVLVHEAYPDAALRVVDLSAESLAACRKRLAGCRELICEEADFARLDYPRGSFDLVVSSIAIHHLDAPGKRSLFKRVHDWLAEDGVFCYADQCAGATDDLYARHIANWKAASLAAGSNEEEWQMWMQHQADCDHHDPLADQMTWLNDAGFTVVDCPWRYLLWSVVQARKG